MVKRILLVFCLVLFLANPVYAERFKYSGEDNFGVFYVDEDSVYVHAGKKVINCDLKIVLTDEAKKYWVQQNPELWNTSYFLVSAYYFYFDPSLFRQTHFTIFDQNGKAIFTTAKERSGTFEQTQTQMWAKVVMQRVVEAIENEGAKIDYDEQLVWPGRRYKKGE
jgi:hypothetical protein